MHDLHSTEKRDIQRMSIILKQIIEHLAMSYAISPKVIVEHLKKQKEDTINISKLREYL